MSAFNAVTFPDGLMHTAPLNLPGTFMPLVSEVTAPANLSADGLLEPPFTYPGHFLALVATIDGWENVVVFPLTQVTVPPSANDVVGSGWEAPPVLAPCAKHPLTVTVPDTVPVMLVHVALPLGPVAANA